jgi:site-specific DNA recombinase
LRLANTLHDFLARLRKSADTLEVIERQKIIRLVVKEVLIDDDTIRIHHSIPVARVDASGGSSSNANTAGYPMRSGRHFSNIIEHHAQ